MSDLYDLMSERLPAAEAAYFRAENAHLKAALRAAKLQLEYLNEKQPRGTTECEIARIETALARGRYGPHFGADEGGESGRLVASTRGLFPPTEE